VIVATILGTLAAPQLDAQGMGSLFDGGLSPPESIGDLSDATKSTTPIK